LNKKDAEFKNYLYKFFYEPYYIKEALIKGRYGRNIKKSYSYFTNSKIDTDKALVEKTIEIYNELELKESLSELATLDLSIDIPTSIYEKELIYIKNFIIVNGLNQYGDFILFGSMATGDFIEEFSDVDMICFLNDNIFKSVEHFNIFQEKIFRLNGLLLTIDPLQNHGIFIVLPYEKDNYNQAFNIPIEVLQKGILFSIEPKVINILISSSEQENGKKYLEGYLSLVILEMKSRNLSYRFFRDFLHRVYLLPAIYLQSQGIYCYKKDSFELIKDDKRFNIVSELAKLYVKNLYKKRLFRNLIPRFLFLKYPIVIRTILNILYGHRKQNFFNNDLIEYKYKQFENLIVEIENE
jgi:hypothetical protein